MSPSGLIIERQGSGGPGLLFIEPYLVDSHRALIDGLQQNLPARWTLLGLAGRHFRWRMRGAAAYLALAGAEVLAGEYDGLLCSSMLNLAELRGLAPGLARLPALVYFHENQLAYPAPGRADHQQRRRDLYLAFSNLTSALAADLVVFNSAYQRDQVLAAAGELLSRLPDARPPGMVERLAERSLVLPVPLSVQEAHGLARQPRQGPLRLVWNHRWEQDKGPEEFLEALARLAQEGARFQVAILGSGSGSRPGVFSAAPELLGQRLVRLGREQDRRDYWGWLFWADLVASSARQEYQGLAVAEAVWAGCRPLVPDALVYPQLYPAEYRYPPGRLYQALRPLLARPDQARQGDHRPLVEHLTWERQALAWQECLERLCQGNRPA